jgi:hypothetical protein
MTFHGVDGIEPVRDLSVAVWIPEALWSWRQKRGGGTRVGAVVPPVFDAYVRVFHSARTDASGPSDRVLTRWADIAAWSGRVAHPTMQWGAIGTNTDGRRWPGEPPNAGSLSDAEIVALSSSLRTTTSTPDDLYLAVWDGYGLWTPGHGTHLSAVPPGLRGRVVVALRRRRHRRAQQEPSVIDGFPLLRAEGREYVVFAGSFEAAAAMAQWPWRQSPNLWWPADRAWCAATEIDFDSTVVGGSRELVDRILASPHLETFEVTSDDRLDFLGDQVNDPDGRWSRTISP